MPHSARATITTRPGPSRRQRALAPCLAVAYALLPAVSACRAPVGVDKIGYEKVYHELTANALSDRVPSEISTKILYILGLNEKFAADPEQTLRDLHERFIQERRRVGMFVLAELSYLTAQRSGDRDHFLSAAVYAYLFLFDKQDPVPADPFSPAFRAACDLYNRALAQALLTDDGSSISLASCVRDLPTGQLNLASTRPGFPWDAERFPRYLPADQYSVRGLTWRVRDSGLGVPVIAVASRAFEEPGSMIHALANDVPATVFLRLDGGLAEMSAGKMTGTLELYSSFDHTDVQIADRRVPLEADLTASLAYSLQHSDIWSFDLGSLFAGGVKGFDPGIYMVQPYSRDKIPIVFVHGTASSPTTWVEMFNSLRADRVLRQRYQFWFFLYSSGAPIAYSASLLRKSLRETIAKLDPSGTDPELQRMVVIGHSQGGLITKMAVVDTGDHMWNAVAKKPLDDYDLAPEAREIVRDSLFFDHLPFVKRVVFISTPHGGSFLASTGLGRMFESFVQVPSQVRAAFGGSSGLPKELAKNIPTSVANMTPGSPFLTALRGLQVVPGVQVNSIVTVEGDGPLQELDDGLVSYESAHYPSADSECVVNAFHTCLNDARVIYEVRRILLMHVNVPKGDEREP
jgi:pimeloyl-ACP methyl ester carboxylesterase